MAYRTITTEDGSELRTNNSILWIENDDEGRYQIGKLAVAWWVAGDEVEQYEEWNDEFECYDEGIRPTGRVVVCMVGDDRYEAVDRDELKPIARDDYCSICGQIGCHHDGR